MSRVFFCVLDGTFPHDGKIRFPQISRFNLFNTQHACFVNSGFVPPWKTHPSCRISPLEAKPRFWPPLCSRTSGDQVFGQRHIYHSFWGEFFQSLYAYMGVSENSGTPKWMVKIMENPIKMGWFGGKTPLFSETSIFFQVGERKNLILIGSTSWPLRNPAGSAWSNFLLGVESPMRLAPLGWRSSRMSKPKPSTASDPVRFFFFGEVQETNTAKCLTWIYPP